jgi:beta-glucanase (GH16 family)
MRLPSCTCPGADIPGSVAHGRSAPEIDIFEASVGALTDGTNNGIVSQSYQIAPFDDFYQPNYAFAAIQNSSLTSMNAYTGGPYQQALSGVTTLNNQWYQDFSTGSSQFQTYGFHYTPGASASNGIDWYVGGELVWNMKATSIGPNGNIGARSITEEPMTIVMNLALSESFAFIDWAALEFPNVMKIDYVRIYQDDTGVMTCDPPGWETTQYIANHPAAYTNKNVTKWEDAGYVKPLNTFMNTC